MALSRVTTTVPGEGHCGKTAVGWGTPLPPTAESLDWSGVCKNALQGLEPIRLKGQNLDNTGVIAIPALFAYTASAFTMICSSNFEVKVRCHMGSVEKPHFSR
jgi:hypothetical protein